VALSDPVFLVAIAIIITLAFILAVLFITGEVYIGWANAIRTWYPPMSNNTIYCPNQTIITPTNKTGLYQCGPCLAYVYPGGGIGISCPK
jgi:hypothetical protein